MTENYYKKIFVTIYFICSNLDIIAQIFQKQFMKLQKTILTTTMALLCVATFAQKGDVVDIKWGDNVALAKGHYPIGFIVGGKHGFIQVSQLGKKEIGFYTLSKNLSFENKQIETLPKSKYMMFEDILEYDQRAFCMFSDFDKKTESEKLIVREIDMKNGGFLSAQETLIETNGRVTGTFVPTGFYSFSVANKFKVVIPDKGNRILVYYRMKPKEKRDSKNHDKIVFHLYDRNWKEVWEKEVTMPYTEAEMRLITYRLIEDDIYLFAKTKSGELSSETKKAEFDQVSVLVINKTQKKPEEHKLELNNVSFQDLIVGKGFGESILFGGYLKPNRRSGVFNGYFTAVFNPETKGLDNVNIYNFKEDLISAFESERTRRKLDKALAKGKDIGIPYLEMREVIRRPGGGWYVIGEQYHLVVTSTTDSKGNVRYTYHYYYQDIIVSAVDASGGEEWTNKVAKNQHFVNSTYGAGISAHMHDDNIYVFHLDNVKNKKLSENTSPAEFRSFKDGCLMCVKIKPDGSMSRNPIYDIRDESKLILPETIDEIEPGKLLSSGRKSRLGGGKVNVPAIITLK